ncbi:MAG: hypothetical protein ABFS46_19625 [Myxococcota bacterium]
MTAGDEPSHGAEGSGKVMQSMRIQATAAALFFLLQGLLCAAEGLWMEGPPSSATVQVAQHLGEDAHPHLPVHGRSDHEHDGATHHGSGESPAPDHCSEISNALVASFEPPASPAATVPVALPGSSDTAPWSVASTVQGLRRAPPPVQDLGLAYSVLLL